MVSLLLTKELREGVKDESVDPRGQPLTSKLPPSATSLITCVFKVSSLTTLLLIIGQFRVVHIYAPDTGTSEVVIPQLLRSRPRNGILGGTSNDVAFEEQADALQWDALGLGYTKDGVDEHEHAACAEEEISAIGDLGEHYGRELGDDEVEEPLCHE